MKKLGLVGRIHAEGDDLDVQRLEIRITLDELSEFVEAVRSPVASKEIQQHIMALEV